MLVVNFGAGPQVVAVMIADYDISGDNLVQFGEFCDMLEGTLIQQEDEVASEVFFFSKVDDFVP